MIRERILFRLFFSLLPLLSFSPFCTYEPTFQIPPNGKVAEGYKNLTKEVIKLEKQREKSRAGLSR